MGILDLKNRIRKRRRRRNKRMQRPPKNPLSHHHVYFVKMTTSQVFVRNIRRYQSEKRSWVHAVSSVFCLITAQQITVMIACVTSAKPLTSIIKYYVRNTTMVIKPKHPVVVENNSTSEEVVLFTGGVWSSYHFDH